MKNLVYSLLIGFLFVLGSCKAKTSTTAPITEDKDVKTWVKDNTTTLVDVRIPEQFKENTAPNAVNIPLAEIEQNLDFFRKQNKIVVFCNSGRQANLAKEKLKKHGITNVKNAISWKNVIAIQQE